MLVNLTPIKEEIERRYNIAKEHKIEYVPQSDPNFLVETGIYQSACAFNFSKEEFKELQDLSYEDKYEIFNNYEKVVYGVADNVEQIKEYYKEEVADLTRKYAISVTPVWQEKQNKGKGGGWRWHKWGEYIGKLNPQHEYLDDENFGKKFQYVLTFTLYAIK